MVAARFARVVCDGSCAFAQNEDGESDYGVLIMENEKKDRSNWVVRVVRMEDVPEEDHRYTAVEGLLAMWPLAIQAWSIKYAADGLGEKIDVQSKLQRHVVRIIRPQS
jgi:hypothetical protein